MRFAFLTAVAFVVFVSAVARITRGDVGEDDLALKKLAGTWEVVDVNVDGQSRMADPGRDAKVMLGRSTFVLNKFDSLNYEARLRKLDPSASPPAVDLRIFKDKDGRRGKFPAVYKLDGDGLQICWWYKDEKKPRPTKIETGEGLRLLVLKRVKEAAEEG